MRGLRPLVLAATIVRLVPVVAEALSGLRWERFRAYRGWRCLRVVGAVGGEGYRLKATLGARSALHEWLSGRGNHRIG